MNRGLKMKKYLLGIVASLTALLTFAPLALAEAETAAESTADWTTPFAIAGLMSIAIISGTYAQGRAIVTSVEAMGRNPSIAGKIQTAMIIGLALVESLVILGFVIAFMKL